MTERLRNPNITRTLDLVEYTDNNFAELQRYYDDQLSARSGDVIFFDTNKGVYLFTPGKYTRGMGVFRYIFPENEIMQAADVFDASQSTVMMSTKNSFPLVLMRSGPRFAAVSGYAEYASPTKLKGINEELMISFTKYNVDTDGRLEHGNSAIVRPSGKGGFRFFKTVDDRTEISETDIGDKVVYGLLEEFGAGLLGRKVVIPDAQLPDIGSIMS